MLTKWLCSRYSVPWRISLWSRSHNFHHHQQRQQQQPPTSCHSDLQHTSVLLTCGRLRATTSALHWIPDEKRNLEDCMSPEPEGIRMHTKIMRNNWSMARRYGRAHARLVFAMTSQYCIAGHIFVFQTLSRNFMLIGVAVSKILAMW